VPHDDIISNDVLDTALRLQEFCRGRGWRFCFIGGLAVQKWSEPRVTDDVDLTLFTGLGTEAPFIDALLALDWVEPRIPRAREFARTRRVLLLQTKGGVGIDIAMGALPFEDEARQGDDALDWRYIHEQLRPLLELKEAPELFEQLETLRARLRRANRTGP
jgi:hypothetical protein